MKKLILAIAIMMASVFSASAQKHTEQKPTSYYDFCYGYSPGSIKPGMKYREIKEYYDYQTYYKEKGDSHKPGWSGFASYVIPGLGQMVNGEVGRGFAWLGGYIGTNALAYTGTLFMFVGAFGNEPAIAIGGLVAGAAGLAGMVTIHVCSIVDAARIAKVKNMYERDLRKRYSFDVDLFPSVNYTQTFTGVQPVPGMTLAFSF